MTKKNILIIVILIILLAGNVKGATLNLRMRFIIGKIEECLTEKYGFVKDGFAVERCIKDKFGIGYTQDEIKELCRQVKLGYAKVGKGLQEYCNKNKFGFEK